MECIIHHNASTILHNINDYTQNLMMNVKNSCLKVSALIELMAQKLFDVSNFLSIVVLYLFSPVLDSSSTFRVCFSILYFNPITQLFI